MKVIFHAKEIVKDIIQKKLSNCFPFQEKMNFLFFCWSLGGFEYENCFLKLSGFEFECCVLTLGGFEYECCVLTLSGFEYEC